MLPLWHLVQGDHQKHALFEVTDMVYDYSCTHKINMNNNLGI